uniref:Potassium channel domain-containing protein n=1 Tax=Plectus sambesii TaxID=2011161 RepID=A0A914XMB8_9BILA
MAGEDFRDIVLFTFTTITTIGYGNISPTTDASKLFCIGYAAFGIPLVFLSLANMGKFMSEAYWMCMICLSKSAREVDRSKEGLLSPDGNWKMPFITLNFLLIFAIGTGAVLFYTWDKLHFATAVYFSFISVMTIGFGDFFATANTSWHCLAIIMYICFGMVVMSTFIGALNEFLHKIHYLGRTFTGAGEVNVWFGGQSVTVAELLHVVAAKLNVNPHDMRALLRDLDNIIESANDQSIAAASARRLSVVNIGTAAMTERQMSQPTRAPKYKKLKTFLEEDSRKKNPTIHHKSIIWTQHAPIRATNKAINALEVVYGVSLESRRRHASRESRKISVESQKRQTKHV